VVDMEIMTLSNVPDDVEEEIDVKAARRIEEKLRSRFPDRNLRVERDGRVFKIVGDFSLGNV
ncbi:MAG: hypothetical protein ACLFS5_05835, partial [Spirochaetaceae bacterium]